MKTLLTEEQLREGIGRMAGEIQKHYEGKPLTIVGVLIGSIVLLADLIRLLNVPLRVDLVQARSYRGGRLPGTAGDRRRICFPPASTAATCCWSTTSSTPATPSGN